MPPRKPSPPVPPLHIRLDARALDALQRAQRVTGGAVSMHWVALASLTIGARALAERPAVLFDLAAEGLSSRPPLRCLRPRRRPPPLPLSLGPLLLRDLGRALARRVRQRRSRARGPPSGAPSTGRAKASAVEVEAASVAIRRARTAGHGTAALIRVAKVQNTGSARKTLRDLAADPRPARTFTRALVLNLAIGALRLASAPDAG